MEGLHRPGHLKGVLMVLDRLFAMVRPHQAYFGEKDHQQLLVVRALVEQRKWGVEVVGVPTVRGPDGLALSSRNQRLTSDGRERAPAIIRTLHWMREQISSRPVPELKEEAQKRLKEAGMEVDYVEIADSERLTPLKEYDPEKPIKGFVAASVEGVRLIDNLALNP